MATTSRALLLPSLLCLFFASIISRHQLFAHAKTKLNIKSSGIDMVHASHILCGSNRTLCEDVMEWLEPLTEDDSRRPMLERGFEELARKFSRCPTGKRNGGDLGYFPRGEMTKDFDGTQRYALARERKRARLSNEFLLNMLFLSRISSARIRTDRLFSHLSLFCIFKTQLSSSRNSRRRCTNRSDRIKRPTDST